tara:strand:- start:917 stop:1384 length:468 start_codon:yes stop_codon:yes gene_type:complete
MDMLFTSTNLLLLWIFAGIICFIPLVVKSPFFKYVVVGVVLGVVYTTFMINKEFIGRARHDSFIKEFVYKYHSIGKINGEKYITMVVHDGKDDLLIRFPWTKEEQKKLRRVQKRAQKGIAQKGKMSRKKKKNLFETSKTDLMFYDFPFQEQFPKN